MNLAQQYGDISTFKLITLPVIVINHPDYVQRVLQKNHMNYDKDVFLFNVSKTFLGNGLVTSVGGESWLRQRRLMQPAFHRQRIADMGSLITNATVQLLERWNVKAQQDQILNVEEEMTELTLKIVGETLFSMDVSGTSDSFGLAYAEVNRALTNYLRFPLIPLTWPTPQGQRYKRAIQTMNEIAYSIIRQRRKSGEDKGDLLSMLIQARDEETGEGMSDQQLRDEVMTLLFAGHETSAKALTWTWTLLAQHPDVEARLHEELDKVLSGRVPTMADLPNLPYTHMILEESMRLYPPSWQVMRQAIQDDEMGGYHIPAHTIIFWSQYVVHRNPAIWDNPEQFDPLRFSPEAVKARHSYAYIPFSGGPRVCIGNNFALAEMQLILATIAQCYRLRLAPGMSAVEPVALITLHPNHAQMQLHPRS
jgi:cytochrome P450